MKAATTRFSSESVQGGEARGRYSIIGLKPDLIWRCRDGTAEVNRNARADANAFVPAPHAERPLQSLRALLAECRMELPKAVPPSAVGVYGYLGYDMVRLIEKLPHVPPDPLGLPDAILLRPTIVAIFDNVRDEILIVTAGLARERRRCARRLCAGERAAIRHRRGSGAPCPGLAAADRRGRGAVGHREQHDA